MKVGATFLLSNCKYHSRSEKDEKVNILFGIHRLSDTYAHCPMHLGKGAKQENEKNEISSW